MDDIITKGQKSRLVFCTGLSGILETRDKVFADSASGTLRLLLNFSLAFNAHDKTGRIIK